MKVLVITSYLGNKGGLGRYSSEVVRASKESGLDVSVLAEENPPQHGFLKPYVLRKTFKTPFLKKMWRILRNIYTARIAARHVEIVHAHDGWPYALYGYCAVLGTKKKLFITGIGTYTISPLRRRFIGPLFRHIYTSSNGIFCISDYVTERMETLCPGAPLQTVYMGVTKLPEISEEEINQYKLEYAIHNQPIFLTVGDIKRRKGQLDTLKGLQLLKDKYPNFLYVIIGSDDDVHYINMIHEFVQEKNLHENVRIISNIYDDKVLSFFYSICDVFLLNSNNDFDHFEGFGLVLLEAAQFGKPVIGSRGCGIESALKDGYNGYLVSQGSDLEIHARLLDILEKKAEFFRSNALEFYRNFSWQNTVEEYYRHYISQ